MNSRLKDDILAGGTNGRLYTDFESDCQLYRVREVVPISANQRGGSARTFIIVQYEKGSARLPLDEHLEDPRYLDVLTAGLFAEGHFSDSSFRSVAM